MFRDHPLNKLSLALFNKVKIKRYLVYKYVCGSECLHSANKKDSEAIAEIKSEGKINKDN